MTDGVGGYAMGTVGGLRTRRYHGLLVVATTPPIGRMVGLVALDPVLVLGDQRVRLATHEWADGTIAPAGHLHLQSFSLRDGVPAWRWGVGDVVVEAEVAMTHGRPAVGVTHRLVRAPSAVRLEVETLCTWRDAHGERFGQSDPRIERTGDGFVFEGAYRVRGPNFDPLGASWWRGDRHREEAARGLNDREDVWMAGRFCADLHPGDALDVEAWAGDLFAPPAAAQVIVGARSTARHRRRPASTVRRRRRSTARLGRRSFRRPHAERPCGCRRLPVVRRLVARFLTSYEGLFLTTDRWDEGRELLDAWQAR